MKLPLTALAPGKINLCLYLGPQMDDGRHRLVTVMESVSLADQLTLKAAPPEQAADSVECPQLQGKNLVLTAIERFKAAVGEPKENLQVLLEKHVPIAAGMGGGSGDAAAMLRLLAAVTGYDNSDELQRIAAELGSDVPSQLNPGTVLATGAGDLIEQIKPVQKHAIVVIPADVGLSTATVFKHAAQLQLRRAAEEIDELHQRVKVSLKEKNKLPLELMHNDLQAAAISLQPEIKTRLEFVESVGCDHTMLTGSGPTVVGLIFGDDCQQRGEEIVKQVTKHYNRAVLSKPVNADYGLVSTEGERN